MNDRLMDKMVLCNLDDMLQPTTGKLLPSDETVIRLFRKNGGQLVYITSASLEELSQTVNVPALDGVVLACNGAVVYDMDSANEIDACYLNEQEAMIAIQDILLRFPSIGVEVVTQGGGVYVVNNNQYVHHCLQRSQLRYQLRPLEELPSRWLQVVLRGTPAQMQQLKEHTRRKYYGTQNHLQTQSSDSCVMISREARAEIMLKKLCAARYITEENTHVLTDSVRDVELLEYAGVGICSHSATVEVQKHVQRNTICALNAGGVGEYLYGMLGPMD